MINFANSTNVYKIWADMIAFDHSTMPVGERAYCAFAGRRDGKPFKYSHEELLEKYSEQLRMVGRVPDALSGGMANQMYIANFPTKKALDRFYSDVIKEKKTRKK